jgi:hypothetical protein
MAAISSIEAVGAPPHASPREEKGARAAIDFGAAVTHRELVQEKLRVDPAALVAKQQAAAAMRPDDPPRRDRLRDERLARQEAGFEARRSERGSLLDIEA